MPPAPWTLAELQEQREKLANSYQELLDEFGAHELRTVGNYTVGRLIGKGSFGKVYLATHKLTNGSKVVLKSAKKDDPNLAREIHHHRQFVHPHIARLYEVIVTENLVWLVLEYCPGDELYHHILENGRLPEDKVQRIFTQLVGAVSYVHIKGCVHRDLKLENILLDKTGNVKLVDFGFTREYQGAASYLQTWCGTVCYSAPEMVKGEKYAGEKVDVWSLGIILFALLAGELPFDDDDESVTKSRILKGDVIYPDHFPGPAKELIGQLLSKRPLLRPAMADILRHSWLAEHSPQQQEILKLQQPAPFSTQLEKDTLHRMRGAGVNTDTIMEHVLAQRCDGLAGWWAILMEKEERKERRRQRRRRDKENQEKTLRRLSAASGRLLAAPMLREINEEDQTTVLLGVPHQTRGRGSKRSSLTVPMVRDGSSVDTKGLPRVNEFLPQQETQNPPTVARSPARSTSSRRRRPMALAEKEKPGSTLRVVQQSDALPTEVRRTRRKIYQTPFKEHLIMLKAWLKDPTRRSRSYAGPESERAVAVLLEQQRRESETPGDSVQRSLTSQPRDMSAGAAQAETLTRATFPTRPRLSTASSNGSSVSNASLGRYLHNSDRVSLSPKPLAHSNYRRRSGLTGRKSTSSSVSSVRSIRVHMSAHSKASSTSSASISIASPNLSNPTGGVARARSRDGNDTAVGPQMGTTPSALGISGPSVAAAGKKMNRRVTPGSLESLPVYADLAKTGVPSPFSGLGPPSPGIHPVFARQRRKVFKGPTAPSSNPRNRGTHLSPEGAHERQPKSSGILEEEEEGKEDGDGTEREVQMHRWHSRTTNRHSRRASEDIDVVSEEDGIDEADFEEVETFGPNTGDMDNVPAQGERGDAAYLGHETTREERIDSKQHAESVKP